MAYTAGKAVSVEDKCDAVMEASAALKSLDALTQALICEPDNQPQGVDEL